MYCKVSCIFIHNVLQLLQKKPSERLCCGRRDLSELKRHPFFRHIQWSQLEAGHIPAPYVPNVRLESVEQECKHTPSHANNFILWK